MKLDEAVQKALKAIRDAMAHAEGDELSIYEAFAGEIGAEVEGWDMRIRELKEDQED